MILAYCCQRSLSNFKANLLFIRIVFFQSPHDPFQHIFIVEVHPGKIDGYRYKPFLFCSSLIQTACHFLNHIAIQFGDVASLFQCRNKLSGRNKSFLLMKPAHQGLSRYDFSGFRIHDRLIKHLKFLFFNPLFEFRTDFHLIHIGIFHIAFKNSIRFQILICDISLCKFCSVYHTGDRHIIFLDIINTTGTVNMHLSFFFSVIEITKFCQIVIIQIPCFDQTRKMIRFNPRSINGSKS